MNIYFRERLLGWLRALWPLRTRWRRSRAKPGAKSATLRRELLRSIRSKLRRSSPPPPRGAPGTTL